MRSWLLSHTWVINVVQTVSHFIHIGCKLVQKVWLGEFVVQGGQYKWMVWLGGKG